MAYKVLCEWQVALLTGGVRLSGVRRAAWGRMLVQMPQLAGCVSDGTAGEAMCSCSKTRLAGARGELNAWDEEMRNGRAEDGLPQKWVLRVGRSVTCC